MKKLLGLTVLLLTTAIFFSCGNPNKEESAKEMGSISKADISFEESELSLFNELNKPYDFEDKDVLLGLAGVKLNTPKEFNVNTISARNIELVNTRENGFPKVGINILLTPVPLTMTSLKAGALENYLESETALLKYHSYGKILIEKYNDSPALLESDSNITDDPDKYCVFTYTGVYAEDENGHAAGGLLSVHINILLDNYILSLRALGKEEDLGNIKDLMLYMLSSLKEYKENADYTKVKLLDENVLLPDSFNKIKNNLYISGTASSSRFAGLGIGVFDLKINTQDFDSIGFYKDLALPLISTYLDSGKYNIMPGFPAEPVDQVLLGKSVKLITLPFTYEAPRYTAHSFYGKSSAGMLFVYVLSEDTILTVFAPSSQIEAAFEIVNANR